MLIPRAALAEAAAALRRPATGLRMAAVEVDLDPLDLVRAGASAFGAASYLGDPEGAERGGLGRAWSASAAGPGRLDDLDAALGEALPAGVEAFLGFSFAPTGPASPDWEDFPAAAAHLPQIGVVRRAGRAHLILAVPPGANSAPVLAAAATLRPPDAPDAPALRRARAVPAVSAWEEAVAAATDAARREGPAKVVLARTLHVVLERPPDPFDLVALLRERFPGCYPYGWQAGAAAFIGASPELLVERRGTRFSCRPLAGSAGRSADPGADRRRGEVLLADPKERAEHAFVVDEITAALRPLATTLEVPPGPVLHRLPGVQHLATPISGTTGTRLLPLAAALHPTPAVGGVPRAAALEAIAAVEGFDRGWYAGGVGWADAAGDGAVAVALRGALVRGDQAILYAGAGITAGSHPAAEAAETDLKLAAVLGLFGAP